MLRIVGVQRSSAADQEFILLQNQGSLRVNLRGHVLLSELALAAGDLAPFSYAFCDEEFVAPGVYVVLSTGIGGAHWAKTKDGTYVLRTYMNRSEPLWSRCSGPVHLLARQHTFTERSSESLLLR